MSIAATVCVSHLHPIGIDYFRSHADLVRAAHSDRHSPAAAALPAFRCTATDTFRRRVNMKMFCHAPVLLALSCAGLCAQPARALSFDTLPTFEAMVAAAPLAFRGKVLLIADGQAKAAGGSAIPYTSITLQVGQAFAGSSAGAKVTLRQLGGRIEGQPNRLLMIPGLAEFEVGDEVYVFADDRKQPFFATLYGDLGLYRVAKDGAGVDRIMTSQWQPLRSDGRSWRVAANRYCKPLASDRQRCEVSVEPLRDRSDTHDVTPPGALDSDVSPAAFDARIRAAKALAASPSPSPSPGQTVSKSRTSFETALVALRAQGLRLPGQRKQPPAGAPGKPAAQPTEESK